MKELLTASRMSCLLTCPRKHYWRYEVGLKYATETDALRFGSAWHNAMEARWQGAPVEVAFERAIGNRETLDELQVATLSGMLAGYYRRYERDNVSLSAEVEFQFSLAGSRTFDVAGKIDGLGFMADGRHVLVEHKTAGYDIAPDSDYWLRLRGNGQVMQYILAARQLGYDVSLVIYDVARKPMIQPREIAMLDDQGCKVVNDANGVRVFKKDGTPRESGDKEKGYTLQTRIETPEEFAERLVKDVGERPDFYFARREVPVLDDDLAEFEIQRGVLARQILSCRAESRRSKRAEHGWPRNVSELVCRNCEYAGFCLQNTAVDAEHVPAGFVLAEKHEELSK